MTYPAGLTTITVRHKVVSASGRPLKGNSVTAVPAARVFGMDGSIVEYEAKTTIDADGRWELDLPQIDQAAIRNKGVHWLITEHIPGEKPPKPHKVAPTMAHGAGPVDLAEVLVSEVTSKDVTIQAGPVTDEAAAGLLDQGGQFATRLTTTIATEVVDKAGTTPIYGSQAEALDWEARHPGAVALWFDAGYEEVTATGPTWTGDVANGGGTWTTPNQPGVVYTPASGTAAPGQTVTVTAAARPGYALVGTKTWTYTFPGVAPSWFTDFTDYTVGQAPDDWTMRFRDGGWEVIESTAGTGGVVLTEPPTTVENRNRALSWDEVGSVQDVEVVMKWRSTNTAASPRPFTRGSAGTALRGAYGGVQNATTHAMNITGGTTLATQTRTFDPNVWYITRYRTVGTQHAVKTWPASEPEPTTWDLEATSSDILEAGWVALYVFSDVHRRDFDWVGVALHGATAPKGA